MSERTIHVWDLPVRLFHWLLVITLVYQYLSAEVFDNAMHLHFYSGYFCLGLILFRLIWGMIGSYYAKFSQFIVSPKAAIRYLVSDQKNIHLGHNPAGAYSVIALLSLVLSQALSGLFLSDEIFNDAPYFGVLPDYWQDIVSFIHHNLFYVLLAAIVLHVLAILFYRVKHKQNLVSAMLSGKKTLTSNEAKDQQQTIEASTNWLLFAACVLFVGILIYLLVVILPPAPADDYFGY